MKKVIVSGLVSVALMAAGCGAMSKEERNKKIEAKEDKTEQVLKDTFYPAMASLGKKASRFAKKHKNSGFWYEITDDQKALSLSSSDNKHTIDITMKKGAGNKQFKSGDVETIIIDNTSGKHPTSVRVETDEDDKPCSKGIAANTEYFNSTGEENVLNKFVDIDRCMVWSARMGFSDKTSTNVITEKIISDMNANFQKATKEIAAD